MTHILLITFSVSFLSVSLGFSSALTQVTMNDKRNVIDVKSSSYGTASSGILKSHSFLSYETNRNKTLTFIAPVGIVASIRVLDLRPGCQDKLILYDAVNTYNAVSYCNTWRIDHKEVDSKEQKTFFAQSGKLLVRFETGKGSSFGYDGFQLTYTATSNIPCQFNEFSCNNYKCIHRLLTCDGHNHCGDRSDQNNCGTPDSLNLRNPGKVAGIVIGGIFFLVAVVCGVFIIVRRSKRTREVETTVIHPPTYQPNPPPSYPSTCYPPPPPYSTYPQGQSNAGYR